MLPAPASALRPTSEQPTGPATANGRITAAQMPVPVKSTDLFQGQKSVVIEHNGAIYRLQSTKLGKLILTK